MTTVRSELSAVEHVRAVARAERGAGSIPLLAAGVACAGPAVMAGVLGAALDSPATVLLLWWPALCFLACWAVVAHLGRRAGVGFGSDGYGFVALSLVVLSAIAPLAAIIFGQMGLVGLALVLLGIRGRDGYLLAAGVAVGLLGWTEWHDPPGLPAAGGSGAAAAALLLGGVVRLIAERRLLRRELARPADGRW